MTKNEIEDIADILLGYESWKVAKLHAIENGSDDQLSVSAYIDDYAKQRAVDTIGIIESMYEDGEVTAAEALNVYAEIGVLITGRSQLIGEVEA